jgi:hypothetical protein
VHRGQNVPQYTFSSIAYGSGQFVAAAYNGAGAAILNSADGVNWIDHRLKESLSSVAYGNGRFEAVGYGSILESGSIISLTITPQASTGLLALSLEGPIGIDCTIQSSADLIAWRDLTNVTSGKSTKVMLEGLPPASDHRFYRAYSR